MESDTLLHFANFSTLAMCMVLKFPQIFLLMRAKTSTGVSFNSLLLELVGYVVFVTYQMYYDYPPPTYLEYPILIAQDAFLLLLIFHYDGRLRQSLVYTAAFVGGWRLLTLDKWIIDMAMSLCTFISSASKFAQLQCLWKNKDAGQVSALSWAMATYTCFDQHKLGIISYALVQLSVFRRPSVSSLFSSTARIYTAAVTTGDMQVLVRFVIMTALNMWVLLTVLYYQKQGSRSKKDD